MICLLRFDYWYSIVTSVKESSVAVVSSGWSVLYNFNRYCFIKSVIEDKIANSVAVFDFSLLILSYSACC